MSTFEFFVAVRYLRAHRKEAAISVITGISVLGVAAGVMALVIAIAVTNGMRSTLERNLLGAMAHINVMEKEPLYGIENWRDLVARIRHTPHVTAAAPALYNDVFVRGALRSSYAALKGVDIGSELAVSDMLRHLKAGSVDRLRDPEADPPGIIIGARMASDNGMLLGSNVDVLIPNGVMTPFGPRAATYRFKICGIFETGMYDIDATWAFTTLAAAQKSASLGDVVNQIEINVDDVNRAGEIGKAIEKVVGSRYTTVTWQERNRPLLNALNTERVVTMIVIGLILMVAALNIFTSLVMMVMEKYRDIAILMSMGARQKQIRRIFVMQGVLIGVVGSALGLAAGYTLSYFANRFRWIPLNETVYSLSFVPFEAHWLDGLWIAAVAVLVSFLATLYPARNATRIAPAEVLRYE
jgi:lipoprotein-releasing system permease protein